MQTFLPYPDFRESARVLDWRRLGNQRNEASIVLMTIIDAREAWAHHPVVSMWRPYPDALTLYRNIIIDEWVRRGYKNSMLHLPSPRIVLMPKWLGDPRLHNSHRANLLRKNPEHYRQFGWNVNKQLENWYPS